jgi:hypothetical protein
MRRTTTAAAAILLLPALALGQEPVKTFDQLGTRLKIGDTVWVTDVAGGEHKGKLANVSASALTLRSDGAPRDFAAENVRAIRWRQPDSVLNGTLIGLAAGAAGGAIFTAAITENEPGVAWRAALVYGGFGAGIGALIDGLRPGKKVLVYGTPPASSARLSVVPVVTARAKGAVLLVSF